MHTNEAPSSGGISYESPQTLAALIGNIDSIGLTVRLFPCRTGEVNLAGYVKRKFANLKPLNLLDLVQQVLSHEHHGREELEIGISFLAEAVSFVLGI